MSTYTGTKTQIIAAANLLWRWGAPLLVIAGLRRVHPGTPRADLWGPYLLAGDLTATPPDEELWLTAKIRGVDNETKTPMARWSAIRDDDNGATFTIPALDTLAADEFQGVGFEAGLQTSFDLTANGLGVVTIAQLIASIETRVTLATTLTPS